MIVVIVIVVALGIVARYERMKEIFYLYDDIKAYVDENDIPYFPTLNKNDKELNTWLNSLQNN